jgi:hypothetical protein
VNMNGRIYDPALARFITPDPIMSSDSPSQAMNRYSYANNSPLRFVDPSGFMTQEEGNAYGAQLSNEVGRAAAANAARYYYELERYYGGSFGLWSWMTGNGPPGAGAFPYVGSMSFVFGGAPMGAAVGSFDEAGAGASSAMIVGEYDEAEFQGLMAEMREAKTVSVLDQTAKEGLVCAPCVKLGEMAVRSPVGQRLSLELGKVGEGFVSELTGVAKNTQAILVNMSLRFPDFLNEAGAWMGEAKNVAYQALTSQLRDFIQFAAAKGYIFDLFVRAGEATRLSVPLLNAESQGLINIFRVIPPP